MSDLLSIILADDDVRHLVGTRYGTAGLDAIGASVTTVAAPIKAKVARKADKVGSAKVTGGRPRKASNNEVPAKGTKFVHKGRDGETSLTFDGESYVLGDGSKHDSLTAAAKHVTGQKSINGKAYFKPAA
jgi:hypothetical protein